MKNRKGFTLTEVLITIAILAILVGIAVPSVMRYMESGKTKYYKSLEQEVVLIARDYYDKNKSELPRGQLNSVGSPVYANQVKVDELKASGLVTNDIVDADGVQCTGYVRVEKIKDDNTYEYTPCLVCGSKYKSENDYCMLNMDQLEDKEMACTVVYKNGYVADKWVNHDVEIEVTAKYSDGKPATVGLYRTNEGVTIKPNNNIGRYIINESKNKVTITAFDRLGNSATCDAKGSIKIEKEAPTCNITQVVASDLSHATLTVTSKDTISGVSKTSINGVNVVLGTGVATRVGTHKVEQNGKYTATVTDVAGNTNTCSINVTEIDKIPPVVALSLVSNNKGSSTIRVRLTDNVGVVGWQITTTDVAPSSWTGITKTKDTTFNHVINNTGTYYVWAKDNNNNIGKSSIYVVVDKASPVVTLTTTQTGAYDSVGKVTVNAVLTDDVGVVGWKATTDANTPTYWEAVTSSTRVTKSFDITGATTYYVWAKDAVGNVSNKKVVVNYSGWSGLTTTYCNTANSLCQSGTLYRTRYDITQYRTRTKSGGNTVETCNGFSVPANYSLVNGSCSSYAQYKSTTVTCSDGSHFRDIILYNRNTSYSCNKFGKKYGLFMVQDFYVCGSSPANLNDCCSYNQVKSNFNCNYISTTGSDGAACYVYVSGENCVSQARSYTVPVNYGSWSGWTTNWCSASDTCESQVTQSSWSGWSTNWCNTGDTTHCSTTTGYQTRSFTVSIG